MPKNTDIVKFMDELDLNENESEEQSLKFLLELDDKTEFHFKEDNFGNKFFKSLNQFRSNELFCDITIKVHNQTNHNQIKAHRVVIAASIPYFRAMFSCGDNMVENVKNEVEIKEDNVSYETFEKIVDYAYSGEITLNLDNVQEICCASSFLCINTLLNASIQFIINNLDHTNILEYKSFSKYFPTLESHVENFISEEFVNIYKTDAFMELPYEEVKKIVSNNELNVDDEKIVYEAVINWVKSDEENRKKYLYSLLEQIKLPYISPDYIVDNIISEDLIKKCLKCRDLIDEAKDWHLLPQRRNLIQNHRTIKRSFTKKENPIIAIGTEGKKPEDKLTYFEIYFPAQNKWNRIITDKRQLKSRTSICVLNSFIYFIGGYEEGIRTSNVEVYSLNDRKWTQVAHLNEKRSALASVTLDSKIYCLGGFNGTSCIRSCEVYDPKTNRWTYISDMNYNRCSSNAVVANNAIYVIGGHDGVRIFSSIEKYDPALNKWEIITHMSKERCRLGATSLNSKLYIAGGFSGNHIDEDTFECFDLISNEWTTPLKSMSKARSRFSLVGNGRKIYAISGCEKNSIINSVEAYDIDTDTWTFVSPMNSTENPAAASLIAGNFNAS